MPNLELEKWKTLLAQLEITLQLADRLQCLTNEQLVEFESQAHIMLPKEYKEFCQIFGQGCFGEHWICVSCPNLPDIGEVNRDIVDTCKYKHQNLTELQDLLDVSYFFGMGQSTLFLFDLRSYSQTDESCNIHAIDDDGRVYQVERSFFQFICNCCLGTKIQDEFPQLLDFMLPYGKSTAQVICKIFSPTVYR